MSRTVVKSVVLNFGTYGAHYNYDLYNLKVASLVLDDNGVQSVVIEDFEEKDVERYPNLDKGDAIVMKQGKRGLDIDSTNPYSELEERIRNLFNILTADLTIKSNVIKDNRDFIKYLKDNNIEPSSYTEKDLANYINSNMEPIERALDNIFNNENLVKELYKKQITLDYKNGYMKWKERKGQVLEQLEKDGESAIDEVKDLAEGMKELSQEPSSFKKRDFTSKMEK